MQWIMMLLGAFLGGSMADSATGASIGALMGMVLGQAIMLMGAKAATGRLEDELKEMRERLRNYADHVNGRLAALETSRADASRPEPTSEIKPEPYPDPATRTVPPMPPLAPAIPEPIIPSAEKPDRQPEEAPAEQLPRVWGMPVTPQPGSVFTRTLELEPKEPEPEPVPELDPEAEPPLITEPVAPVSPWSTVDHPRPRRPSEPDPLEKAFAAARDWLFGGNTVLRIGALLLFLGLAFLLRYAAERMTFPIELRYAGVALAAVVLLALGWRLRDRNAAYGLMLQGTGVAVMYLTLFAAMRLHPLIPPPMALGLMVFVTAFAAMLAVIQDSRALAIAAAAGGFAAPILTSTGGGNHVGLFSYFILLNAGILGIAAFKAWRSLNFVGFVGTFGIGFAWGAKSYTPELFASTEPFLIVFFLMYVGIGLLFARSTLMEAGNPPDPDDREALLRWSSRQINAVDGTTMFGPPIIGFGLQYALIRHLEFGPAFSALGLGLFYMVLARLLESRFPRHTLLLVETCLALGVIFGTLAIPLGLEARWTSAAWAVEGAGILWLGVRQGRPIARAFGLALQFLAGIAFVGTLGAGDETVLNGAPLGALMLGLAGLFSFWQLRLADRKIIREWEMAILPMLACVGLGFLYLIAPLMLGANATVIVWALAGFATLWAGLRIQARSFLLSAFAIQLLGGGLFLTHLRGADDAGNGVFSAGLQGLMTASFLGLALITGMIVASRDRLVREDESLMKGLSVVLLTGLIFMNLAVLFVLPWPKAALVWGGSGLLILWLSLHLRQRASFFFGALLELIAGIAFIAAGPIALSETPVVEGIKPLAHAGFWTPFVLAVAAFAGAWRLHRETQKEENDSVRLLDPTSLAQLSNLLLVWGSGWWLMTWIPEVWRFVPAEQRINTLLLITAASILIWTEEARRFAWGARAVACMGGLPAGLLALLASFSGDYHPAAHLGWAAWLALLGAHLWALYRAGHLQPAAIRSQAHVFGCWLILAVLSLELRYLFMALSESHNAWRWLGWALVPAAYLALVASERPLRVWPLGEFAREYRVSAAGPVAVAMLVWFWLANAASNGSAAPLPYLPLVNPLELGLLFVLIGIYRWLGNGGWEWPLTAPFPVGFADLVAGASLFALLNGAVFRGFHHYADIPYELHDMLASMQVQAGLSILWSLIALGLMISGHARGRRDMWIVGAVLVAVVVAKLFLVELGNHGSLARIVSFIGVGVLLLIVGYFAPLPPRQDDADDSASVNPKERTAP